MMTRLIRARHWHGGIRKMGVEQVWQTSFATPIPKILVHCIIDSLMNLTPKGTSTPKWGDGFGKMQFGNWCIMN
jgi:hypothetical protein